MEIVLNGETGGNAQLHAPTKDKRADQYPPKNLAQENETLAQWVHVPCHQSVVATLKNPTLPGALGQSFSATQERDSSPQRAQK